MAEYRRRLWTIALVTLLLFAGWRYSFPHLLNSFDCKTKEQLRVFESPKPLSPGSLSWKAFGEDDFVCKHVPDASTISLWKNSMIPGRDKLSTMILKRGIWNSPSITGLDQFFKRLKEQEGRCIVIVLVSREDRSWSQDLKLLISDMEFLPIDVEVSAITITPSNNNKAIRDTIVSHKPDIVIDARATMEMNALYSQFDPIEILSTPKAENMLREWKQNTMRTILESSRDICHPQLLILVAYEQPHHAKGVLSNSFYTRTVQNLASWYQVALIVVPKMKQSSQLYTEQFLAYALLEWTNQYCNNHVRKNGNTRLLLPGVKELVETVLSPALGLDSTWQGISGQWEDSSKNMQQGNKCI